MVFSCFKLIFSENWSEFIPRPDFSSLQAQKLSPPSPGSPGSPQRPLGSPGDPGGALPPPWNPHVLECFCVFFCFDMFLVVILFALLMFPMILIAILIRLTSKGSALHWSERVGKNNRNFLKTN